MPPYQASSIEDLITRAADLPVGSEISVAQGFGSFNEASQLAQGFADRVLVVLEKLPGQLQPGQLLSLFTVHDLALDLRDIPEPHEEGDADASMKSQAFVSKVRQHLFQSLHGSSNGNFLMDGSQMVNPELDTERLVHFRTKSLKQLATRRLEIVAEDLRVPHGRLLRRHPTLALRRILSGLLSS